MARIRTIKPEFWRNEGLASVSPEACLLAIGLLNFADDEGYFVGNPKLIESDVFPLRECSRNVHGMLTELSEIGYIRAFIGTDGKKYGHVVKFCEHQRISHPQASKIKPLDTFTEDSWNVHGTFTEGSSLKGKERNGKEGEKDIAPTSSALVTIEPRAKRSTAAECPDDVFPETWADWLALRRAKKAPATQTALDGIRREADKAGWSLQAALREAVARGWTGFKADWVNKQPQFTLPNSGGKLAAALAAISQGEE